MKQELQQIAEHLERINRDLREESQVWEAEQKDRLAKGLKGEAAIEHYNEWMAASGETLNDKITWQRKRKTSLSVKETH